MSPRVLLFTGKGGVGKTTVAAATAAHAARRGLKTLAVSIGTAHSLSDALGGPGEIAPGLRLHQVDTQRSLEEHWDELSGHTSGLLGELGLDEITAEEVTVLPGAEEVIALLELQAHVRSGDWDVVVVDCAPTAATLRLLALPEALDRHAGRLLPVGRRLLKTVAPFVRGIAPDDGLLQAAERLHQGIRDVRELLTGPDASVRLVLTPEAVVLAETGRALTSLNLYGYRVDAVVANRVFPAGSTDPWSTGWARAQAGLLAEAGQSFAPLPVHVLPYLPAEPIGADTLAEAGAALYGDGDPFAPPSVPPPLRLSADELRLALPGAERGEVDLARKGEELIVTAGPYRRIIALPASLTRRKVASAVLQDGFLQVRFVSDRPPAPGGPDD
ncbi:ArsA family ATPase [Nonomuraea longicatena]|uniref:ArsA family ATPase n=1 Tax=Nonomuraea longicatena TaxID=83682 RepID=A0ABP4A9N4_9ACTN